jgi:hypothetical protein
MAEGSSCDEQGDPMKEKSVILEFLRPAHLDSDVLTADLRKEMVVLVGPAGRVISVSPELPEESINTDPQFLHTVLDAMREKILTLESENRGLKTHVERMEAGAVHQNLPSGRARRVG